MERWRGRVALVTGASSGIGAAIAERLVNHGMVVVGFARRAEKVEALSKKLSGQKGKLYSFKGDLQKEEDVKAVFTWVENILKSPVHVLVNNAGFHSYDTALDGTAENWRQTLDVNVLGLSLCTREAVKSMRAHSFDEGHIININSITAHTTMTFACAMYSASKAAVLSLTEAWRKELSANKSRIRVTSISPGVVKTEATEMTAAPGLIFEDVAMLLPSDIADAVDFVISRRQQVHVAEVTIIQELEFDFKPMEKALGKTE